MGAALAIGRARLTGPGAGQGRALLGPALEAVPLDRLGLPPGALLLVPRLASPRPLRPGPARADFADAVARGLAQALAEAEHDPVTGIASRPRLFTSAAAHWAWRIGAMQDGCTAPAHHPPGLHPATRAEIHRSLLPDGRLLPPVIARLTAARRIARFLGDLTPEEIGAATEAVAAVHGLAPLPAPAKPDADLAPVDRAPTLPARPPPPRLAKVLAAVAAADPGVVRLAPAARRLLVIAVDVANRPEGRGATHWLSSLPLSAFAPDPAHVVPEEGVDRPRRLSAPQRAGSDPLDLDPPGLEPRAPPPAPPARPAGGEEPTIARVNPAKPAPAASSAPEFAVSEIAAIRVRAAIKSRYAGLLFLLNALVVLGLTPGPSEPRARGLAPFPTLERLGRRLFGRGFAADPLAALLAADLDGERWTSGGRNAASDRAWRQCARGLAPSARRSSLLGPSRLLRRDPAGHTALLARRLARRLAAAGVRPADLRLVGTLRLSDTHLDASFALADLPLAVRLSGLDRDPGFLPLAGRGVRFHFA